MSDYNEYTLKDVNNAVSILLNNHDLSEAAVIARVTNQFSTEAGFSEDLVRNTPAFVAHFSSQSPAEASNSEGSTVYPVGEDKASNGDSGKK